MRYLHHTSTRCCHTCSTHPTALTPLGVPDSCPVQKWDNADALLYICRQLWGLSYIAPVYTLLLHQWLLLNKDAGGQAERQKHVSVCIQGDAHA